jgi:peptide/nickel transport system permease protein
MSLVLRRTAISLVQLLVVSAMLFVFFRLLPGDIYTAELENPQISKQSLDALREAHGLNQSWPTRYVEWLVSSARGDFGTSLAYGIPVRELLAPRIGKTLGVALPALLISWLIGLGGALVNSRTSILPSVLEPGATVATMVPDVAAVSILLWLAVWAGVSIAGIWLPIAGLAFAMVPVVFLHASGELRHAFDLDFVRIGELHGIRRGKLWGRYALRAAANPLISLAGISISAAISSSFVVEVLTGWPGIGPLFLEAVQARDYAIVQTVMVLLAAVLIFSNFFTDLILYRLDPRIRLPHAR